MVDKIFDDSELYWKRFSCDCLDPTHIVDLSVEFIPGQKENTLLVEFAEKYSQYPLWERIKNAFKILLGKEIYGHGFIVRPSDIPEMIELLEKAK